MFKKLLLPVLLLALTVVTSCKKSDDKDPEPTPQTVKLEAASTGNFDVDFGVTAFYGGYRFLEMPKSIKTYTGEYAKVYSGDVVSATLTGATSADITATLKMNGTTVAPTVDKKDDKGNTVKSWQFVVK